MPETIQVNQYQSDGEIRIAGHLAQAFIGVSNRKSWKRYLKRIGVATEPYEQIVLTKEHLKYLYVFKHFVKENHGKPSHATWVNNIVLKDWDIPQFLEDMEEPDLLTKFETELTLFLEKHEQQQSPKRHQKLGRPRKTKH